MIIIPGSLLSALTFPGVIVHEASHQLVCRWTRVAIFEVCYFQFGNPAGYVSHEPPSKVVHHVLIGVAPFLFCTLLGALIAFPAAIFVYMNESPSIAADSASWLDVALFWVGFSIATHAFPSSGDAQSIWQAVWNESKSWTLKIAVAPLVGFIYLLSLGSMLWLDFVYAALVCFGIPYLLILMLI